jgi:hypothetical protein
MKAGKKKQNLSILLATYWTLWLKSGDFLKKHSLTSGKFGSFFSHEESFV